MTLDLVSGESHWTLIWTYALMAKRLDSKDCAALILTELVSSRWRKKSSSELVWLARRTRQDHT